MGLVERIRASELPDPAERRAIRTRAGVTIKEIADEIGVGTSAVHAWETGRSQPQRESAIAYRRVLDELRTAVEEKP